MRKEEEERGGREKKRKRKRCWANREIKREKDTEEIERKKYWQKERGVK